jgi:septal ring factor EnvC (AmiA/AmiB activator)
MKRSTTSLILCGILLALAAGGLRAAEPASIETRMRDAMRNMALQLRNIQAERDDLAAKQAESAQKQKTLDDQIKALTRHAAGDKAAIDALNAKVAERDQRISGMEQDLAKWKAACDKAADLAKSKEAERAKLAERVIVLDRQVADQRTKNAEMFKVGKEILARYEKFGLGTAITAREPFTGAMRVKLENLVQDYSDKLDAQRIKPEPTKAN